MDTNTLLLWIVIILAGVAIVGFVVYRTRTRTVIKGPFNTEVSIDASNESSVAPPPAGVSMTGVKAGGDVKAHAKTGGAVKMDAIEAKGDVTGTTENPRT